MHILQQVLSPGSEFLFKTDHPEYYEWVLEQVEEFNKSTPDSFFNRLPWPEEGKEGSFYYPKTDFQIIWEGEGKKMGIVRYKKQN